MDENINIDDILSKIDDIPLVPDEELENMDFYDLAYYIQTLNNIEAIGNSDESVGEE